MLRLIGASALAWLATASAAMAHGGHDHAGARSIGWTFDPQVTVPLALTLAVYLAGLARLRSRSARGRSRIDRNAWLFLGGWFLLAAALVSPLHAAGEVSFAMHMVEHEVIMLPAALLLAAAHPGAVLMWGLPRRVRLILLPLVRAGIWQALSGPVAATVLQAVALVMWHVPALFSRALVDEGWHVVQHLCFLGSALLFWWAMLAQGRSGRLVAALCLFVTSGIGGGLGALMTLGSSPWYAPYVAMGLTPFGLSPQEDQQLAGVIMWVPGGLFHLAAALACVGQALRGTDAIGDQPQKVSTTA